MVALDKAQAECILQNVLEKLHTDKSDYSFIEILMSELNVNAGHDIIFTMKMYATFLITSISVYVKNVITCITQNDDTTLDNTVFL